MSVEPGFNRSETRAHTPQADVTTVLTHSADPDRASALVRLLNYGLSGPEGGRVNCTVGADASVASSVTMTFDYFGNASLDYDPGTWCALHSAYRDATWAVAVVARTCLPPSPLTLRISS
jgi:hypothetical protein